MNENLKKNKSCECCPYGFHIDIDFLNSLERNRNTLPQDNYGKQRNVSSSLNYQGQETQIQNLKELMRGLCKYLDKMISEPEKKEIKNKFLGQQSPLSRSHEYTRGMFTSNQPQTVPRTLHRQNLIKTGGLIPMSSRSISEDENHPRFLRKSASVMVKSHAFHEPKSSDELNRIKSQVENVLSRLQLMEDKEELILSLQQKINSMNSEKERLITKLCSRCKGLILHKFNDEDSRCLDHHHKVARSQSLRTCKPVINQKTFTKIPSAFPNSKLQNSILPKSFDNSHQTVTNGHSRKEFDQDLSKCANKLQFTTNTHRPRSTLTKCSTKTKELLRSNTTQVSKTFLLPKEHPQTPPKLSLKDSPMSHSKIPFVRDKLISKNKFSPNANADRRKISFVPSVTRSNSFDASERRMYNSKHSSSDDDDDDDLNTEETSVSGRKEQRKNCRRSLSLVTTQGQDPKVLSISSNSSEEELGERNGFNSDHTDEQSSTSFDEGAYDGESGQIIYKQTLNDD